MKKVLYLMVLVFLLCSLIATAEVDDSTWSYTSDCNFICSLEADNHFLSLAGHHGTWNQGSPRLEVWSPDTSDLQVYECEGYDGSITQGISRIDENTFVVLRDREGNYNYILEYISNETVLWSSTTIPNASRVYVVGEYILVNSFPDQASTSLILIDKSGNVVWSHDWKEHLYFENIIPSGENYLAFGRTEADDTYGVAVCLDMKGNEIWRYDESSKSEIVAAISDEQETVLLSNRFSGAYTTHLLKLQNGFLSEEQNFGPSDLGNEQSGPATSQTALDMIQYGDGYIVALSMQQPLADNCLIRYINADGNILQEWLEEFSGVGNIQLASFIQDDSDVYLGICGKENNNELWSSDITIADIPTRLIIKHFTISAEK